MTTVYFDFETGGLLPNQPNIQLAAVAVDDAFNELDSFEAKIQFDVNAADAKALEINHYSEELWKLTALPEAEVVVQFQQFLRKHATVDMVSKRTGNTYKVARLAGHNAATFDNPRLMDAFKRHNQFLPAHPLAMDTMQRAMWFAHENGIQFESLKLGALCAYFKIALPDAHDALADVRGCVALAKAMRGQQK